jgi:small subunit ribosomal protein S17
MSEDRTQNQGLTEEQEPTEEEQELTEALGGEPIEAEASEEEALVSGPRMDLDEGRIQTDTTRGTRKERVGMVVSDAPEKTVSVAVETLVRHPLYKKRVRRSKKFLVHDEQNEAQVGDTVRIIETRPISKLKRWRLANVISRAE